MLVAQVEREPDAVAGLRRIGDAGAEGVDFALGQHLGKDAGCTDEVLFALDVESSFAEAVGEDAVLHFDCLPPYRGGVANQAVQLVGVEGFPDEFRVVDEVLDFGLHGMYPFS